MTVSKTVQARSRDAVLTHYEMRGVASWAVFVGNQLMHPFCTDSLEEGFNALDQYLGLLEEAESSGIYTLRVYGQIGEGGRITPKTDYDGSINFRFLDQVKGNYSMDGNGIGAVFESYKNATNRQIEELKKEIRAGREEKEGGVMGVIGQIAESGLLERLPEIIGAVQGVIAMLKGQQIPPAPPPVEYPNVLPMDGERSSKISGIDMPDVNSHAYRIRGALIRLEKSLQDPQNVADLLTKLADLAEYNPKTFALYKAMFDRMKIKKG